VSILGWIILGLIAGFILPFGLKCAKWLSFVSCLLNAGMVLTFVVVESARSDYFWRNDDRSC